MSAYMSQYDREKLAEQLAGMSPDEIEELRRTQLTKEQREAERRARLALPDLPGSVRMYSGFENRALLVRIPADEYDDQMLPEHQGPDWMPFTDYKAQEVKDWQLKHDQLSEPIIVLTADQMRQLGLDA
jgi:hypothetical protein